MLFRTAIILLVLFIVLGVVIESHKNKIDASLTSKSNKNDTIGKKFHLDTKKTKATKLKNLCRTGRKRFYYDSKANECKLFTCGRCQGNKNNFQSMIKCQQKCKV